MVAKAELLKIRVAFASEKLGYHKREEKKLVAAK
jgi:hypothetical protein